MTTIILNIHDEIKSIVEKNKNLYIKRLQRIEAAYKEENEMMSPNEDCNGRLHAPCSGYRIPQVKLDFCDFNDCYEDTLFSKGEFLPIPIYEDQAWFGNGSQKDFSFKSRILVKDEMINVLKLMNVDELPVTIGFGKSWTSNNETCAYAYISSCWKSVVDVFKNHFEILNKKTKDDSKPKGKAPVGEKIIVKAKVIGIPLKHDMFDNPVFKLMLEFENGSTAFGSLPKKINHVKIGEYIEFKGTFKTMNDVTHSFYKSPSKAKIIEEKEYKNKEKEEETI